MSLIARNGRVAVVGAGVSGLCYSYFLSKLRPDLKITVYESGKEPGGWIKSLQLNDNGENLLLEKGPRTLRGVSNGTLLIVDIMKQLGAEKEVEVMSATSKGNRKWLVDPANQLVQVPNTAMSFVKFLMSDVTNGLVSGLLKEPFRKPKVHDGDESIRDFIQRRFGSPALADNILSAVMHGIYSGDVAKLSVKSTLSRMVDLEKEHGSILRAVAHKMRNKTEPKRNEALVQYEQLLSPKADLQGVAARLKKYPIMRLHSGLQTFPRLLAQNLGENVELKFGSTVESVNLEKATVTCGSEMQYDHVRFTSGFKALAQVASFDNSIRSVFDKLEHSTIFLANVFTKKGGLIPPEGSGFGFLVPRRNKNPESLLGVIYDSATESDAERFVDGAKVPPAPYDKVTLMMGGHYFNSRGVPSAVACLKAAKRAMEQILHVDFAKYNLVVRDEAAETSTDVNLAPDDMLISYNFHQDCIPQYNVGYGEATAQIAAAVEKQSSGKVTLGGPSMGKLGVPDCVMGELEAALAQKIK